MTRNLRNIWPTLLLCSVLLGVGGVAGFLLRPLIVPTIAATDPHDDEPAAAGGHGSSSIVELSETTLENMELKVGKFESRNYFQTVRIPAQVVERVPQSRRSVTAPIAGRVTKVYVARGQAVEPGEKLFEIRITDESIATSQVALLDVFAKLNTNQSRLERLKPLVASGVTARTKLLDVEFEINDLTDRRAALLQELGVRGMDDKMIQTFVETKKLSQDVTIVAPKLEVSVADGIKETVQSENPSPTIQPASTVVKRKEALRGDQYFTVETISALEGSNLELGESLCELTHHSELLIKGLAFEGDIDKIAKANQNGWKFTAQFGEGPSALVREKLPLYLVGNHVDSESQAFPIYVEIKNEIVNQTTDSQNRTYVNWRFKPGQRAHLEVPVELWENQVVVPLQAMVREGPETFVFLKISHTHTSDDGSVIHEFQKIPVKVLHTDKRFAVLKKDSRLDVYEEYALNLAYQLNLALKQAAGGGADPHAGHSH